MWFCTWTRFDAEAKENSEIACFVDVLVAVHCSGFPGTRSKETLKPQMHTPERKHKIMCNIFTSRLCPAPY